MSDASKDLSSQNENEQICEESLEQVAGGRMDVSDYAKQLLGNQIDVSTMTGAKNDTSQTSEDKVRGIYLGIEKYSQMLELCDQLNKPRMKDALKEISQKL